MWLFLIVGPMSPPRNLSIFNHSSDSVWLHWEPSLEPSGVIQHYGFKIVELNMNSVIYQVIIVCVCGVGGCYVCTVKYRIFTALSLLCLFLLQNSTGAATQAELRGFKPHSSYEISVSTYTRAGNGDQYSLPVTFTTSESGKIQGRESNINWLTKRFKNWLSLILWSITHVLSSCGDPLMCNSHKQLKNEKWWKKARANSHSSFWLVSHHFIVEPRFLICLIF